LQIILLIINHNYHDIYWRYAKIL